MYVAFVSPDNCYFEFILSFQFEVLEQLGFEGYAILVNTGALQTHLLATTKGKDYHKAKQQSGKPLENPFIGYVFSENSGFPFLYSTFSICLFVTLLVLTLIRLFLTL